MGSQVEEKLQQLASENRRLIDDNQKLKMELSRAMKLVADLSVAKFAAYEEHEHEHAEALAE